MVIGYRRICITIELNKAVYKFPDGFVARMENMSPVFMDVYTFHFFTINISSDMIPFFDDQAFFSGSCGVPGDHSGKQSAANKNIIILCHDFPPKFNLREGGRPVADPLCALSVFNLHRHALRIKKPRFIYTYIHIYIYYVMRQVMLFLCTINILLPQITVSLQARAKHGS